MPAADSRVLSTKEEALLAQLRAQLVGGGAGAGAGAGGGDRSGKKRASASASRERRATAPAATAAGEEVPRQDDADDEVRASHRTLRPTPCTLHPEP